MKESRNRPESDDAVDFPAKRQRSPSISDDYNDEDDFLAEFLIQEETVMEMMKGLEEELSCPDIIDPSSSSSSLVTINGNEESCGPTLSNSSSTVMASFDMGCISISYLTSHNEELPSESSMGFQEKEIESETTNGCDVEENDDEWLTRVLNVGPFEFEDVLI